MISKMWSRKPIASFLAVAVLSVYSMFVLATPGYAATPLAGELASFGAVTVNGQKAASGTTVFSDSMIVTATDANATVSLGKLGRVEVLPGSTLSLSFTENGLSGQLEAGQVRVSTPAGIMATINTKDGMVSAKDGSANVFTVDLSKGPMNVTTQAGAVATTGGARLAAAPLQQDNSESKLSGGALAALVLAAGGAVVAIILAGRSDNNDLNFGGTVTVVSPTR